jgi:uncharacterized protein (DUF1697 family)
MTTGRMFIFLRAVNLGKRNKVPMRELVAAIEAAGLGEAGYLLQTGNLIFPELPVGLPELRTTLERLVLDRFQVQTSVIARTPGQLGRVLAECPFAAPEGGSIQVSMWDAQPDPDGLQALAADDYGADSLHLTEQEAFMRYAASSRTTRLNNSLIERRLKLPATARNIRTLQRLLDLAD